ncbi:hypothetical protein Atc_1899 [Acidithiobacillus caldus SM-1]|uniref:Uncharacterized protein n=1 Tax=Acidithiobacillus caldus (strain SM-1) TaxID=990288 RepID=F9ZQ37_ACICS|nr:hypothetical protein Atc_0554 [Acidithiobacillus caldus SM-1]AEK58547.1 hypothetical protein Atc_1899 [Acidithiobacillus caldus SM-1]
MVSNISEHIAMHDPIIFCMGLPPSAPSPCWFIIFCIIAIGPPPPCPIIFFHHSHAHLHGFSTPGLCRIAFFVATFFRFIGFC